MLTRVLQNHKGGIIPIHIGSVAQVELLELLGNGAFGTVWKVKDVRTESIYVLKVIQKIKPNSTLAERVRLEAEVSVLSNHIVPAIGLCEWDRSTFLILFEYFTARPLNRILREETLTPERKRQIFNQILVGVADAHRSNVIHRDLKPENILVGDQDLVKLIDFGLSKFKGKGLTSTGEIMGTPPYMSPEILIEGSKFSDARADIYALGHILYEMAMGKTFWARQGWRNLQELGNFLGQKPQPKECIILTDFRCDFYRNAKAVLVRMVKRDPKERYATVDQVIAELSVERVNIAAPAPILGRNRLEIGLKYPLLIVESGTNKGALTLIRVEPGNQLVLGRADIAGSDCSISRRHLAFTRQNDRYFVSDLRQKPNPNELAPNGDAEINPTLLGGVALELNTAPSEIFNNIRLKVGNIFLCVVLPA